MTCLCFKCPPTRWLQTGIQSDATITSASSMVVSNDWWWMDTCVIDQYKISLYQAGYVTFSSFPDLLMTGLSANRVFITSDLASANVRMKHAIAYRVAVFNAESQERGEGVILLIDVHCGSHIRRPRRLRQRTEFCFPKKSKGERKKSLQKFAWIVEYVTYFIAKFNSPYSRWWLDVKKSRDFGSLLEIDWVLWSPLGTSAFTSRTVPEALQQIA